VRARLAQGVTVLTALATAPAVLYLGYQGASGWLVVAVMSFSVACLLWMLWHVFRIRQQRRLESLEIANEYLGGAVIRRWGIVGKWIQPKTWRLAHLPGSPVPERRSRARISGIVEAAIGAFSSAHARTFAESVGDLTASRIRYLRGKKGACRALLVWTYRLGFAWLIVTTLYLAVRSGPLGLLLPSEWVRRFVAKKGR